MSFHVPDALWCAVVPSELRQRVVCLSCFDAFAKAADVGYADQLGEIWFVGEQACMKLRAEWVTSEAGA
jgi:hypothetical protein